MIMSLDTKQAAWAHAHVCVHRRVSRCVFIWGDGTNKQTNKSETTLLRVDGCGFGDPLFQKPPVVGGERG